MKKFLVLLVCLLFVGCSSKVLETNDIDKFKKEYEDYNSMEDTVKVSIDNSAKLKYLNVSEVVDFLENKTGIIYFGFPTCPWCRNIIPVLLNVAKDNNETVYYFNPRSFRGTDDLNYSKIMNILNDYLESDENGEKVLYVPDVYFLKNGNIVGHNLGSVDSQTDPYIVLDDTQKQELYNIYKDLLDKTK